MRAVVATPGKVGSGRLVEVADPAPQDGEVLVRAYQAGLDGTDAEIIGGQYGEPPPAEDDLIIGHESLGRIQSISKRDYGLGAGDWVVPTVRRPDPVPCRNCAAGEWDMCLNERYSERGIKRRHGYLADFYVERPENLVKVPQELIPVAVLLEPLSIVEKAVEQTKRIQSRMLWRPERAMVLGAGPIGLLAALLLRLDDLEVHVYDRTEKGVKPQLIEAIGAKYVWAGNKPLDHDLTARIGTPDFIIEATGFSPLAFSALDVVGPNGVVCLTGVSAGSRKLEVSADHLNLEMVLMNKLVFGTVSSNRRHFESGVEHLATFEQRWPGVLSRMITHRLPMERFAEVSDRTVDRVKTVVDVIG